MMNQLRPALLSLIVFTLLTGAAYPLLITGVAQTVFPHQANGSLMERDGQVVGSSLIGQQFDDPRYFWSRLSATSPAYNAAASSGSNLGPLNPALLEQAQARIDSLRAADPALTAAIPIDLATSSGSGLDPHISPAAAEIQVTRVAAARKLSLDVVRELVRNHTTGRTFGIIGETRVNVLELNLAMDAAAKGG